MIKACISTTHNVLQKIDRHNTITVLQVIGVFLVPNRYFVFEKIDKNKEFSWMAVF